VSVVILAVIFSRVAVGEVLARAGGAAPLPLAVATGLALGVFVVVALRWRQVARLLGVTMTVVTAVRAQFVAMFGGQVLPSAIGIDVLRGFALAGRGERVPGVVASLVADRILALFAASLLALPALVGWLGAPLLAPWIQPVWLAGALGPAAIVLSGGVLAALLHRLRGTQGATLRSGTIGLGLGLALIVQVMFVLMAALAAGAYGVDASLSLWLAVIPSSVIVSSIPVSLNGWGVREATIVVLSGPLGVPAEEALLVSVTLGALNMLASLPGAVVLLQGRGRGLA